MKNVRDLSSICLSLTVSCFSSFSDLLHAIFVPLFPSSILLFLFFVISQFSVSRPSLVPPSLTRSTWELFQSPDDHHPSLRQTLFIVLHPWSLNDILCVCVCQSEAAKKAFSSEKHNENKRLLSSSLVWFPFLHYLKPQSAHTFIFHLYTFYSKYNIFTRDDYLHLIIIDCITALYYTFRCLEHRVCDK